MYKLFIISVFLVSLISCESLSNMDNMMLGMGRFSESVDEFDGAKRFEVTPARLPGATALLGARWSSAASDYVTLVLAYDHSGYGGYTNIRSISVNIEGQIAMYKADNISKIDRDLNIFTSGNSSKSVNSIVIPFAVFEQMLNSADVRLRLDTSDGYEDSVLSKVGALNGAKPALLKLYDRINEMAK